MFDKKENRVILKIKGIYMDFELFKSNVCHTVKRLGDISFLLETLQSNLIQKYYKEERYLESFYLLAMVDYLSRLNSVPQCSDFDYIRQKKVANPVYSLGIIAESVVFKSNRFKKQSLKKAIPEFLKFNIVENDIRNVC
jgi:hypothetical protein